MIFFPTRIRFLLLILLPAAYFGGCSCEGQRVGEEDTQELEDLPPPLPEVAYDGKLRLVAFRGERDGEVFPLDVEPIAALPDGADIYLETWQRLEDHRVRFLDSRDRLLPFSLESGPVSLRSLDHPEPGGTWFRLTLNNELQQGEIYSLRIEAELEDRVTDYQGRSYDDLVLEIEREVVPELSAHSSEDLSESETESDQPTLPHIDPD